MRGDYEPCLTRPKTGNRNCRTPAILIDGGHREDVRKHSSKQLKFIKNMIQDVETQIRSHIESDPELKAKAELLLTIPTVGEVLCWGFLSETPNLKNFKNAKQLAAFAGLNPSIHESGTSVRGRRGISKTGSASLRKLLYLAGMSAMRFNPVIKSFSELLRAKGKNGKVIVIACMRKLLHIIYGVLTKKQAFVG